MHGTVGLTEKHYDGSLIIHLTLQNNDSVSGENPVTPPGIDPGTVRLVAQRLNHYATPGPVDGSVF
jgi:hypothetical protein